MDAPDLRHALRRILSDLTGLPAEAIAPDLPLLDEGYLTSLQVVELVARLERELKVVLADQEVTAENFGSLAALETLLADREAPP